MDSTKIKPRSLRLSDEVMEKLKEITADLGGNQQHAMEKLMEVYDKEQMRVSNSGVQENMDIFEGYMSMLSGMYLTALKTNQDMRELVREEFKEKLESKDKIILDLQERLEKASAQLAGHNEQVEVLHSEIEGYLEKLEQKNGEMEQIKAQLTDTVNNCTNKVAEQENKQADLQNNIEALKKQLQAMTDKNAEISKLLNDNITKCESLSTYNAQLIRQTDILERENEEKKRELLHKGTELEALRIKIENADTVLKGTLKDAMQHAEQEKKVAVFEARMELQAEYEAKLNEILGRIPQRLEESSL